MDNVPAIVIFFLIFGGGTMVTKMWTEYNRTRLEMARIKLSQPSTAVRGTTSEVAALRAELEATRQELRSLRDTSMQYDISFDTALERMENRVGHVERRVGISSSDTNPETVTLTGR